MEGENGWVLGEDTVGKIIELLGKDVAGGAGGRRETDKGKDVIKVILQKLIRRSERLSSCYQLVVRREDRVEFITLNVEDSQKYRLKFVDDAAVKEEGPEAVEIIPVGDDLCLVTTMSSKVTS